MQTFAGVSPRKRKSKNRVSQLPFHLMILPAFIILIVYKYLPMAGIIIAFQKFDVIKGLFGPQRWVGLDNFRFLFNMPDFNNALKNTLLIASLKLLFGLLVPMVFALLLNEIRITFVKRTIQTFIYLPHFLSWIILSGAIITLLSPSEGIVNQLIKSFGGQPIFFLADRNWFRVVLIVTDIWKEFGWGTIIYLATLAGIDPTLYEAAEMDGANRLQEVWHITIPGISHIVVLLAVLSLGKILNAGFDQIFNLYSPLVYDVADIIDTLSYRVGMVQANYSLSTAIGLFKSVTSLILTTVVYYLAYKFSDYRVF